MAIIYRIACLALVLLLSACAQVPKQAFNRASNTDIKTIGLLAPANSGEVTVANLGHPAMGFGLIGGLVAAADMASKTKEFTQISQQKSLDYVNEYKTNLIAALEKAGYVVKILSAKRDNPTTLFASYDHLDASVDAYLDLGMSCGYFAAGATADYIPAVQSNVKMIKRSTKEIIYQEIVSYGYEHKALQAISIPADNKYFFKDFDSLKSNADKAIEGIRTGFPLVADQIASDIRR